MNTAFLKPWVVPVSVGVAAFAGGIGFGYVWGKKVGKTIVTYEVGKVEPLMIIPESQKTVMNDLYETPIVKEKTELIENLLEEVKLPPRPDPEDDHDNYQPLKHNVFAHEDDGDWDYEAELQTRSKETPYVIHRDEFFNEEMDFSQSTLTYYQGDDILVDENDVPIYNHPAIVGDLKFGHGSRDKSVVYVRNEKLEAEYEVLLSTGHYAQEVLGIEVEKEYTKKDLKHSLHKFRSD